jgi:hypothetical protein
MKLLIVEQFPAGGKRVAAGSVPEHQEVTIDRASNCSRETTQHDEVQAHRIRSVETTRHSAAKTKSKVSKNSRTLSRVHCAGPRLRYIYCKPGVHYRALLLLIDAFKSTSLKQKHSSGL